MESELEPEQALLEAERATAALWIDYPPTPAWYYPAGGAWTAALILAIGIDNPILVLLAMAVIWGLFAWFWRWYTNLRGAMPRPSTAPPEFRRAIWWYIVGMAAVALAIGAAGGFVGVIAAAAVAFVGITTVLYLYERAYERAAQATRERLG